MGVASPESIAYNNYCFMKPYFMMCVFVLSHKVKYIIKSSKLKLEYHYKVFGHWGRLRNVGKGVSLWHSSDTLSWCWRTV